MEAGSDKQELQLAEGKYALLSLRATFCHAMNNRDFVHSAGTVKVILRPNRVLADILIILYLQIGAHPLTPLPVNIFAYGKSRLCLVGFRLHFPTENRQSRTGRGNLSQIIHFLTNFANKITFISLKKNIQYFNNFLIIFGIVFGFCQCRKMKKYKPGQGFDG